MASQAAPPPVIRVPTGPMFANGVLTKDWFWFFYQIFTSAAAIVDLQALEAFDSNAPADVDETAARLAAIGDSPAAVPDDALKLLALAEIPAGVSDELAKLSAFASDAPRRTVFVGTHALRLVTAAVDNAVFFETDTDFLFVSVGGAWVEVKGAAGTTLILALRGVGGSTAVTSADFTVFEFGAGTPTVTLPDATTVTDQIFCIKASLGPTAVAVGTVAGQLIDGASGASTGPNGAIWVQSDGGNWHIIAGYNPDGVTSLNALTGALAIIAGNRISVTPAGSNIAVGVVDPGVWFAWTPTVTTSGTSTQSGLVGFYQQVGKLVYVRAFIAINWSGNPSFQVNFPLPVTARDTGQCLACSVYGQTAGVTFPAAAPFTTTGNAQVIGSANFGTGQNFNVIVEGVYEAL